MKTIKDNDRWITNTGNFMTNKIALENKLSFPQWSNKRVIEVTEVAVNLNDKQRYKAIFGLGFVFENKFDVKKL